MNKNILYQRILPRFYVCVIILYLAAVLLRLSVPPNADRIHKQKDLSDVTSNWFYQIDEGVLNISSFVSEHRPKQNTDYHLQSMLPSPLDANYAILFTTKNSLVTVSVNQTIIYQLAPLQEKETISYLGDTIHLIQIPSWAAGQMVHITFEPITDHDTLLIDTIYSGNEKDLLIACIKHHIPMLIVSVLILCMGILLFVIGALNIRLRTKKGLLYLGLFSIGFGIYCIIQCNILSLFIDHTGFLYEIELLTLALLPYSALRYVLLSSRTLPGSKRFLNELLPLAGFLFVLAIYATGLLPLSDTKIVVIVLIGLSILTGLYYSCKYLFQNKVYQQPAKHIPQFTFFMFQLTLALEFFLYFLNKTDHYLVFSHYILLAFLLVILTGSFREIHGLCEIGADFSHLQNAAYYDALTGLGNRTALNHDIEKLEQFLTASSSVALIQLDINYLKRTNDLLGHIAGDRLLKNAASVIQEGFSDYGKCYRFGGDEFIVILENHPKETYNLGISAMESACEILNSTLPDLEHVSIAYGIAYFNYGTDNSLWRVQERADEAMYERKRRMKQKKSSMEYKDDRL
ncbi:MAG: GGDEF domain-containing protein [Lachnospiraceae bacterium]|nr:GGDEF domain-containing protein [Lachnospiraceae bacterium]